MPFLAYGKSQQDFNGNQLCDMRESLNEIQAFLLSIALSN